MDMKMCNINQLSESLWKDDSYDSGLCLAGPFALVLA